MTVEANCLIDCIHIWQNKLILTKNLKKKTNKKFPRQIFNPKFFVYNVFV